ncbi:MAG: hypothetical protein K0R38_4669 [Polyangiaceae bacterium]|jgi:hypothetical protein|nr:hypothetical protein [Polyangiaceae bacterium]
MLRIEGPEPRVEQGREFKKDGVFETRDDVVVRIKFAE